MTKPVNLSSLPMAEIVSLAWAMHDQFDLADIGYGRIHWGNQTDIITTPFPYYYFLAGMVRLTGARRVVEVGTHQGGSARAMAAGLAPQPGKIVTFDISADGVNIIGEHPTIKAFQCDANSEQAYRICLKEFGADKIDFAYIDTTHNFWPTVQSFIVYAELLKADFIVLDDITLNVQMSELWSFVRGRYGESNTVNAAELINGLRPSETHPGFGVVRLSR